MKIGEYRIIPKGTYFWSLPLQSMICMDKDCVVKLTNTVHNNNDYFYGILQLELFKFMIPGLTDKTNGEIGMSYNKTNNYVQPRCIISFS